LVEQVAQQPCGLASLVVVTAGLDDARWRSLLDQRSGSRVRRLRIIGVGMGPQHVTAEAAAALRSVDHVLAFAKADDDPLLDVRTAICREYGDPPVVVIEDPQRDRDDPADYPAAVRAWHEARVASYAAALREHPGDVGLLVWGDPSLYDSTLRLVDALAERVELDVDVVPGISAPQLLAARHRIVLHEVGRPVHVTTGRRLRKAVAQGQDNIVVMLNRTLDLDDLEDWTIWWGANLGTASEALVAGRVGDVRADIDTARARVRAEAGWVMDVYLLRRPS
jgi:precorrin-6A synthase